MDFGRALDALVGGGTALVVSSLLLPVNPMRLLRESAEPVLDRLAAALEQIAAALTTRRPRGRGRGTAGGRARRRRPRRPGRDARGRRRGRAPVPAAPGRARRPRPLRRGGRRARSRDRERPRARPRGGSRAINLDDAIPPEAVQAIEELAAGNRALADYLMDGEPEPARSRRRARRRAGEQRARGHRQPLGGPHRRPDPPGRRGPPARRRLGARRGAGGRAHGPSGRSAQRLKRSTSPAPGSVPWLDT